jgi:hypothetical protein
VNLSDTHGSFLGRSVDVSRGGLFVLSSETRRVGTLLRIRVLGTHGESVFAVGVVVRCFADLEGAGDAGNATPAMAIALTSTSEAWDRFWDDVNASDDDEGDDSSDDGGGSEDLP